MEKISEKEINTYRARAILYTAFPEYSTRQEAPIYWQDLGLGNKINPHKLAETLNMNAESLASHLKGEIPSEELLAISVDLGFTPEELGLFDSKDILEQCIGKDYLRNIELSFIEGNVLRNGKKDVERCMPCEAVDSYALQLFEYSLSHNPATVSVRVTASKKSPHLWMITIPDRAYFEAAKRKEEPHQADGVIKAGIGNNGVLNDVSGSFLSHILPVAKRNLNKYKGSIDNETERRFRNELYHSAEILGVRL